MSIQNNYENSYKEMIQKSLDVHNKRQENVIIGECKSAKLHLKECDADGYCMRCGYQ